MTDERITRGTTAGWRGPVTDPGDDLVDDVHREGVFRLGVHAAVSVLLWIVTTIIYRIAFPSAEFADGIDKQHGHAAHWDTIVARWNWLIATGVTLGVTVLALTRFSRVPPLRLLDLGYVYYVMGGLMVAYMGSMFSVLPDGTLDVFGVSWTCIWILSYPMAVPTTHTKMLISAMLIAWADPLLAFFRVFRVAGEWPEFANVLLWAPSLVSVFIATLPAKIQWRLQAKLRRARELGSYRVLDRIGEGGMGEVWRAEHRYLVMPAAVKFIRPDALGARHEQEARTLVRRFEREAQATASLESPHSIRVFDFGVRRDGVFYYVMEYLDGFDLESFVRDFGPMPSSRVARLLRQMCDSLADAHEKGLIHRDVKPANVFLCRRGLAEDFAKVLDFGLVKDIAHEAGATLATVDGVTTGTPATMSPEQVRAAEDVDARSDLYSLGCVGYWLLTGRNVFEGKAAMEMIAAHLRDAPTRPSELVEGSVDPELERVVLWCLEKDRDARPSSARELARQLEDLDVGDEWDSDRARRWWERHAPGPSIA